MTPNEQRYLEIHKQEVYNKISTEINQATVEHVVREYLYKAHVTDKKSAKFQEYYFKTLNNEREFCESSNFFQQFKKQYSLQGIDNKYLGRLEARKPEILKYIREEKLAELYFDFFKRSEIKHGDHFIEKDLGSFFAKLVHTFRPNDYCALDNPIKNYLGLSRESFFLAFSVISNEYKQWSTDNKELLLTIRNQFKLLDTNCQIKHDQITDMKLLDLIFWSKANPTPKLSRQKHVLKKLN